MKLLTGRLNVGVGEAFLQHSALNCVEIFIPCYTQVCSLLSLPDLGVFYGAGDPRRVPQRGQSWPLSIREKTSVFTCMVMVY